MKEWNLVHTHYMSHFPPEMLYYFHFSTDNIYYISLLSLSTLVSISFLFYENKDA